MIEPLRCILLLLLRFFTTHRLFPILPTFPTCSCPLLLYTSFLSASLRQLRADEASTLPHVTLYHDHRNLFATFLFLFFSLDSWFRRMRTCNHHLYSCAGRSCRWTFFSLFYSKIGWWLLHFCCSASMLPSSVVFSSWFFSICRYADSF